MARCYQVLLVEDEPGDARLMALALERSGLPLTLHLVDDGIEAIAFLGRRGEAYRAKPRPDIILLDLKMPGKNGLDTLKAIKQIRSLRYIPVIVITTSTLPADVTASYQLGAAGYLVKPADLNAFISAIDALCQYWCKLVRLPEVLV
jgi:CheY-like chemotaxis protein